MITYLTPYSLSISAEISPVYAPEAAQCTFSAPMAMLLPAAAFVIAGMSIAGTQRQTSQSASLTRGIRSLISFSPLAAVIFIFQFPAIKGFLDIIFS